MNKQQKFLVTYWLARALHFARQEAYGKLMGFPDSSMMMSGARSNIAEAKNAVDEIRNEILDGGDPSKVDLLDEQIKSDYEGLYAEADGEDLIDLLRRCHTLDLSDPSRLSGVTTASGNLQTDWSPPDIDYSTYCIGALGKVLLVETTNEGWDAAKAKLWKRYESEGHNMTMPMGCARVYKSVEIHKNGKRVWVAEQEDC